MSNSWLNDIKTALKNYLKYVNWTIDEDKTLDHLKELQKGYSTTSYRKRVYQIRKFLLFLNVDLAQNIKPPSEPEYIPKHISKKDINDTLSYFKGNELYKQIEVVILLGCTSGIRPEELYQIEISDIDFKKNMIHINHNPLKEQTTKTSWISFFTDDTKQALVDYLNGYNIESRPFNKHHISKLFKDSPIQIKDLRKYFSQEWDRRGGPTSIKKILMGHSLKGDVDLMHYNYQSEEDLKRIYNKTMNISVISPKNKENILVSLRIL